jgi:hypothetical protein
MTTETDYVTSQPMTGIAPDPLPDALTANGWRRVNHDEVDESPDAAGKLSHYTRHTGDGAYGVAFVSFNPSTPAACRWIYEVFSGEDRRVAWNLSGEAMDAMNAADRAIARLVPAPGPAGGGQPGRRALSAG